MKRIIVIALLTISTLATQSIPSAKTVEGEFDCVSTASDSDLIVFCDTPAECPDADRMLKKCEHSQIQIAKDRWPEAWGSPVPGRLLRAKLVKGNVQPVASCSNQDMLARQLRISEQTLYARPPVNRSAPANPCLREVSSFIASLLGE